MAPSSIWSIALLSSAVASSECKTKELGNSERHCTNVANIRNVDPSRPNGTVIIAAAPMVVITSATDEYICQGLRRSVGRRQMKENLVIASSRWVGGMVFMSYVGTDADLQMSVVRAAQRAGGAVAFANNRNTGTT
ncbi:hypothetical protein V8E55_001456 [Tylopilus felleus]